MNHSNKIKEVIILGPSGAGKGTQAQMVAEKYNWVHISMGKLFRDEIGAKTDLGKQAQGFVEKGLWVPSELTMAFLRPKLKKLSASGFVLDGFPRIPDQPQALQDLLSEFGTDIDLVIHLDIKSDVIMARRKAHWAKGKSFYKEGHRSDETEESIKSRIAEYEKNISPILSFYEKQGILYRVNGERSIEDIFSEITKIINNQILKR